MRETGFRSNIIVRYWRGDLSLAWSYWGVGLAGALLIFLLQFFLAWIFDLDQGFEPKRIFAAGCALWTGSLVIIVWELVGLWRSASKHAVARRLEGKSPFWARAAQATVIASVIETAAVFALSGIPQTNEFYRIAFLGDPDIPDYELERLGDGTEVSFYGGIKYGSAADLEEILNAAPEVTVLHLTSPGGRIAEALKMHDIVEEKGLKTYVPNECSSACTLVFSAGSERWLLYGARLGFHGPSMPGYWAGDQSAAAAEWASLYEADGIAASFVSRALAVSPSTIWYPPEGELMAASVVTHFDDVGFFARSRYDMAPPISVVQDILRSEAPIIDALHEADSVAAQKIYFQARKNWTRLSDPEVESSLRRIVDEAMRLRLPDAGDEVLRDYAALLAEQYEVLGGADPEACFAYATSGEMSAGALDALPEALLAAGADLSVRVLRTAHARKVGDAADAPSRLQAVTGAMKAAQADMLDRDPAKVRPDEYALYCAGSAAMYRGISRLPAAHAASVMRMMFGAS